MDVEGTALKLLIGLAKFAWLKRLKNSARNSTFLDSPNGNRLSTEKSTFVWLGPRKTFRPTLPMSVPVASAVAAPFELGINWPAGTTGRANANGLKKNPFGILLVAVLRVAPGAQLGRASGFAAFKPYNEPASESPTSIGRPDIDVTIPATCQLEKSDRPRVDLLVHADCGKSHR